MTFSRPDWITKYTSIGFSKSWADNVIEKHPSDLCTQLPASMAPENFISVNPLKIENDKEFMRQLTVPKAYTLSEVTLFTLDLLETFSDVIPNADSEIYNTYSNIQETNNIEINEDFDDFYLFIHRLQCTRLTKMPQYQILSKTIDEYTYNTYPLPNTTWDIPYEDGALRVTVDTILSEEKETQIRDAPATVTVKDILRPTTKSDVYPGDEIVIEPQAFNYGGIHSSINDSCSDRENEC